MPKNVKGHMSVGQKVVSILIAVGTGILHAFLKKKGIEVPMDELINPATTGGLAGGIAAAVLKGSGKKDDPYK